MVNAMSRIDCQAFHTLSILFLMTRRRANRLETFTSYKGVELISKEVGVGVGVKFDQVLSKTPSGKRGMIASKILEFCTSVGTASSMSVDNDSILQETTMNDEIVGKIRARSRRANFETKMARFEAKNGSEARSAGIFIIGGDSPGMEL